MSVQIAQPLPYDKEVQLVSVCTVHSGSVCIREVFTSDTTDIYWDVAQLVERSAVNRNVWSSNLHFPAKYGVLVQLVRIRDCLSRGHRFKSDTRRHRLKNTYPVCGGGNRIDYIFKNMSDDLIR